MHSRSGCAARSPRSRRKSNRIIQQIEALSRRLEGQKRALELFESEQSAIAELLGTSLADGTGLPREMETASAINDAESGRQPEANACANAGRARYSDWPS